MGRKRSESRVRTGDSHQIWCSVSSTTRSNAKKSSSLVKSTLRPTPRLSTWKTIPPGECRLGLDIHGFLSRYPSFVNLVAVTNGTRLSLTHWALRCYGGKHRHIGQ